MDNPDAPSGGRPECRWGVQSGDVDREGAVVWCRSDRPATLAVEWSLDPTFLRPVRVVGPRCGAETDFTAKVLLRGLPPGARVHYRARFVAERASDWSIGSLATPPDDARTVRFAWSGDTNGQGWGIDPTRGGMPAFATLADARPDFFLHCGDAIYADQIIAPTIALPDGTTWNNLVTPAKSKVAETLDDFRGAHLYPRASEEFRRATATIAHYHVWDDHEVHDNWYPGLVLADERYTERRIDVLAARARQAWTEHTPSRVDPRSGPTYRSFRWGPHVEVFLLDGRAHRTANAPRDREAEPAAFLGDAQARWLEAGLLASKATWKVVVCDMPIGLSIAEYYPPGCAADCARAYDGWANEDGPPRGRERELAGLLSALRRGAVKNVVWLTADVHYAAAVRYDPARAAFHDFDPFWEFVAGPMHAAAFPRGPLDDTFGPEVTFATAEGSPHAGGTNFGLVAVDPAGTMTVRICDGRTGRALHSRTLLPA